MKLFEIIDNVSGKGAVPYNQEIDYFGRRVLMKPSTFLRLVPHLSRSEANSVDFLKQHLEQGGKIAAPWLQIKIPDEWKQGDFSTPAEVVGHEGRNRMLALQEVQGDQPVEVHLLFPGLRARNITSEYIDALQQRMLSQNIQLLIKGPLFTVK